MECKAHAPQKRGEIETRVLQYINLNKARAEGAADEGELETCHIFWGLDVIQLFDILYAVK